VHPGPSLIACGRGVRRGVRVPASDPHTINACWCLFLSFAYLLVAEAASFDKKELCRSDTRRLWQSLKMGQGCQRKEKSLKNDRRQQSTENRTMKASVNKKQNIIISKKDLRGKYCN
jgi:hypothetical protein